MRVTTDGQFYVFINISSFLAAALSLMQQERRRILRFGASLGLMHTPKHPNMATKTTEMLHHSHTAHNIMFL
jgi:hypothetical protein